MHASELAAELVECRQRGLDRLDVDTPPQSRVRAEQLGRAARDYCARTAPQLQGRIGCIKKLLSDALTAYGKAGNHADAELIRMLFFGDSRTSPAHSAGDMLKYAMDKRGVIDEKKFRDERRRALDAFAEFLLVFVYDMPSAPHQVAGPEAEISRLLAKARSYKRSGAIERAAEAAADAVEMCYALYGRDHPTTLQARTEHLWWLSEAFEELSLWRLWRTRKNPKTSFAGLPQRWEKLIADYRNIYGPDHRKTLEVRSYYVSYLCPGLSSDQYRQMVVDLLVEAEHSLGRTDNFTLRMRWWLANSDSLAVGSADPWHELAREFDAELGYRNSWTVAARHKADATASAILTRNCPNAGRYPSF